MVLHVRRRPDLLLLVSAGAGAALLSATVSAEGRFNGLVGVTSDYVFRGSSQTRGEPAWQAGVGYEHNTGAFAGAWASRIDFDPQADHELEIDYTIGYGRDLRRDFWGEIALRHYTYPRSPDPLLDYDHTEITGTVRFRDLITLSVSYSPGWSGYTSLGAVRTERLFTIEGSVQYPLRYGFSVTGGLGSLDIAGATGGTSLYWNAGIAHQHGRLTIDLSYYDADSGARTLFDFASVQGDVVGAIVYQF